MASKWYQPDEWGKPKRPEKGLSAMSLPVSNVYLHHSVTPVSNDSKADMLRMHNSVVPSKYVDTPYNVAVHLNGDIFTGRYLNNRPALGAHTGGHNSDGVGIVALGNFENLEQTDALIDSIAHVIATFVELGWVTRTFKLIGHYQVKSTACPGKNLKDDIANILGIAKGKVGGAIPATPIKPPVNIPDYPPKQNMPAYPMLLKRGTKGNFVRQFQQKLRDRGWKIGVDGIFGKETEAVVRKFQAEKANWIRATYPEARGLSTAKIADGIVGKWTWNAIWKAPVT